MTIIRTNRQGHYLYMNKTVLQDERLSWRAKGILAFMLTRPDDWHFYKDELMTHSKDGHKAFDSGFNELKKYGYVERFAVYENNRISHWNTIVYEEPGLEPRVLSEKVVEGKVKQPDVLQPSAPLLNQDCTKQIQHKDNTSPSYLQLFDLIAPVTKEVKERLMALANSYGEESVYKAVQALQERPHVLHKLNYLSVVLKNAHEKGGRNHAKTSSTHQPTNSPIRLFGNYCSR